MGASAARTGSTTAAGTRRPCAAPRAARTSAARLLGLDDERAGAAERLALLQAGGLRAAFGSDGKSLQVGMAAAAGVQAARIAAGGASITADVIGGDDGFAAAFGAAHGRRRPARRSTRTGSSRGRAA